LFSKKLQSLKSKQRKIKGLTIYEHGYQVKSEFSKNKNLQEYRHTKIFSVSRLLTNAAILPPVWSLRNIK